MADVFDEDFLDKALEASRILVDSGLEMKKVLGDSFITFSSNMLRNSRSVNRMFEDINSQQDKFAKFEVKKLAAERQLFKLKEEQFKLEELSETIRKKALPTLRKDVREIKKMLDLEISLNGSRSEGARIAARQLRAATNERDIALSTRKSMKEMSKNLTTVQTQMSDYVDKWDSVSKKLGILEVGLKGLSKIPGLGQIFNSEEVLDNMQKSVVAGNGMLKTLGAGWKAMPKTVPWLAALTLAIEAAQKLFGLMFVGDKYLTQISREVSVTKDAAVGIVASYTAMIPRLETQLGNLENIVNAQTELNKLSVFGFHHSQDMVDSQIQLTKEYGLSEDAASNLQKTLKVNGKSGLTGLKTIENTVHQYVKANNILINTRKIIEKVSGISGELRARFRGGVAELTKAVINADRLGISLEQAKASSAGLLDFQSSIQDELETELLLNKRINLESARVMALQGDYLGAQAATLKEIGLTYDDINKTNVVAFGKAAKLAGMTTDEYTEALAKQKYLTGEAKLFHNQLKDNVSRQKEFTDLLLMNSGDFAKTQKQLEASEKFSNAMQKAQDVFTNFVTNGYLDKIVYGFEKLANLFVTIFGEDKMANLSRTAKEISDITEKLSYATGSEKEKLNAELKIAESRHKLAEAQMSGPKNYMDGWGMQSPMNIPYQIANKVLSSLFINKKQEDFISRGDTITPFRKDDIVMAGTSLDKGGNNSEVVTLLKQLISVVSSGGNVYLDSNKVGYAQLMATVKSA